MSQNIGGEVLKRTSGIVVLLLMAIAVVALLSTTTVSQTTETYDWHTPEECAECHYGDGAHLMPAVVGDWEESEHALSYDDGDGANDYCARCKSPLEFNPDSGYGNNNPIPPEEWQGITCNVCHTPRIDGHRELGNYIPGSGNPEDAETWEDVEAMYVFVEHENELCEYCHEGSRHESVFLPGIGRNMYKKGVTCVDCHMPDVTTENFRDRKSHTWEIYPEESCGINREDCHPNKDGDWAQKQIDKENIHNVGFDSGWNHPWQDNKDKEK
ncbi:MAG: hypothetical protein JSW28_02685 [Thermoplasmata archaeon]|nr:MAG: hypothetical protein JSW28_02685 [Thermoplasmata archaeon]